MPPRDGLLDTTSFLTQASVRLNRYKYMTVFLKFWGNINGGWIMQRYSDLVLLAYRSGVGFF